jgi:lipopolysaccharide transport system permease protein
MFKGNCMALFCEITANIWLFPLKLPGLLLRLLNPLPYIRATAGLVLLLLRNHYLLLDMARRDIRDQYLGRAFGAFWAVAQPLFLIGLYLAAFVYIFRIRLPADPEGLSPVNSFALYVISGIIPFFACQNVLTRSTGILSANANLVRQVIFPVELLPIKIVASALLTQFLCTALMLGYIIFTFHSVSPVLLLWLPLLAAQYVMLIGCSLFLSVISPFFKDMAELINLLFIALMYGTPIFYNPDMLPETVRSLMIVNPLHHLLQCHRDLFYEAAVRHTESWGIVFALAGISLGIGARTFAKVKIILGNII